VGGRDCNPRQTKVLDPYGAKRVMSRGDTRKGKVFIQIRQKRDRIARQVVHPRVSSPLEENKPTSAGRIARGKRGKMEEESSQ